MLKDFLQDEEGATAIEYALLVSSIAMVLLTALYLTSESVEQLYLSVAEAFQGAGEA